MKSSQRVLRSSIGLAIPTRGWYDRSNQLIARPRGTVRCKVFEGERLIGSIEGRNLFVNAGLPALAALPAGDTTGEFAVAVGSGNRCRRTDVGGCGPYGSRVLQGP